ncbi:nuclear envelope integral membrane protein 2 isoform X2 [Brachyhypopomus gauderio]|uniref:nuclear envelope integral membrane protein 2 isoform X2 n=1 Tax=Brachyhypopomus gauderio TaxID=698409 RepID=UPI00404358E9
MDQESSGKTSGPLFRIQKEKALDIPLVEEDVFFMTKSPRASAEYTLHVTKQRFNRMRFFLFLCGLMLFFFAGTICRSSLFFYISGISLGIVSIPVFLLLVLKRFVPKGGLILVLLGAVCSLSYLGIKKVINEWDEITRLYWKEMLGYLLVSGIVSLALCYRLGPITSRKTLNLMTWAVQTAAVTLVYLGVTYTPASWTLLAVLLGFKVLPVAYAVLLGMWRQTCWLLSSLLGVFGRRGPSRRRLLTEDEYRQQGETHTKASLEELRNHCTNPGFPAWETVIKLRSPQRFARFLHTGAHVSSSEQQVHEQCYRPGAECGINGLLDSDQTSPTSEDLSEDELNSHSHNPPSPSPYPTSPALPSPVPHTPATCPYPLVSTPLFESPFTDDDDPF